MSILFLMRATPGSTAHARAAPDELRFGHRLSQIGTLPGVAIHALQGPQVRLVLHAVGDRHDSEVMRQLDGRPADAGILGVAGTAVDEAAVELQLAEGQLAQPRERGEALAEIVDRERDAVDAQLRGDLVDQATIA